MLSSLSIIFLCLLLILIVSSLVKLWLTKKSYALWSPISIISLTLIYYVIIPSFWGDISRLGANSVKFQYIFYIGALLFYICILIGFSSKPIIRFRKWNRYFNKKNSEIIALFLFLIGIVSYIPFRGFRTTIWADDALILAERVGFVSYFIDLIALFCAVCGLLLMHKKANGKLWFTCISFIIILYLTLVVYIVGGFRVRLVYLLISLATIYHIFPTPRRFNYFVVIPVAIIAYLGFAVMDTARKYGAGIDKDLLQEISFEDAKEGAGENVSVCCFSIVVMDYSYRTGEYAYFEPIINAALMPLPRVLFPWKPSGEYASRIERNTLGDNVGAAYLNFTEAFISFSWLGIILYGLFVGWVSKIFWMNYIRNPQSMGAVLLLALFNGFCYQWISRGYMGSNFNSFLYFVVLPFWLTSLLKFFFPFLSTKR